MIFEEKIDNCNDVMVPLLFKAIFHKERERDETDIEREGGIKGDTFKKEKKSVFSPVAQFESRLKALRAGLGWIKLD